MKAKIITLYKAHGDGGEWGVGPVIGYALTEYGAKTIAKGKGWYGGDGIVTEGRGIKLDSGEIFALESEWPVDIDGKLAKAQQEQRKAALAKLSVHERNLLGV